MSTGPGGFQRARHPAQVQARRAAILEVAVEMLSERPISEISLRELSERVGLAKSNVLRYFDCREAIFLEVLEHTREAWLAGLEAQLPDATTAGSHDGYPEGHGPATEAGYSREVALATALAASVVRSPLLCELFSALAGALERNISLELARTFTRRDIRGGERLAELIRARLPYLSGAEAAWCAEMVVVLTAGLWPYANPTPEMAAALAEHDSRPAREAFAASLTEGLVNHFVGLASRHRAATGD